MSEKLEAKLVYDGTRRKAYKTEYGLGIKTIIGRAGDIEIAHDCAEYIGEGYNEVGIEKGVRTSRKHAQIIREGNNFLLEDLGSKVGTYVNGVKLGVPQPEPWKVRYCHSDDYYSEREPLIRQRNMGSIILNDGDVITLGKEMYEDIHQFIFRILKQS